jgi:hypothetical protein
MPPKLKALIDVNVPRLHGDRTCAYDGLVDQQPARSICTKRSFVLVRLMAEGARRPPARLQRASTHPSSTA